MRVAGLNPAALRVLAARRLDAMAIFAQDHGSEALIVRDVVYVRLIDRDGVQEWRKARDWSDMRGIFGY